ncbi:MAG: hypothetical protein ACYS8I_06365 [Planctomycetota bacterium]
MSTLTKILIVLLTVSSVFLCGIIVTYVANAQDYKAQADSLRRKVTVLKNSESELKDQKAELTNQRNRLEADLKRQIASLKTQVTNLDNRLKVAERDKNRLSQEAASALALVESANQTAQYQTRLYESTNAKLVDTEAKLANEIADSEALAKKYDDNLAIIDTLEAEKRRLQEQLAELQTKLDQFLRDFGKEPVRPKPITPLPREKVKPAPPIARKTELKALITDLDVENSFAEISIGAAQGVKEGMRFFVTRGADFICEIFIIHVDTEKAIGVLERLQDDRPPKVGDQLSTSL